MSQINGKCECDFAFLNGKKTINAVLDSKLPTTTSTLVFFVNGKKVIDSNVDPEWTLLHYLRNKLRLTGSKLACGEGGCGACTVMVSKYDRHNDKVIHIPVNACLAPVCSMHGLAVTTVEGIGSSRTRLHPVQERLAKSHGSQCGFCTPGIVMSMYTLLRNCPEPTMENLETTFQGNLCRCTGYRPIIEGFKTFTCAMGENCCKLRKTEELIVVQNGFTPYDSTQEPIFPPELKLSDKYESDYLEIRGESTIWFRPTNLQELLELKQTYPEAKIIGGNTEVGLEVKLKNFKYPVLIHPYIEELAEITSLDDGIRIGGGATLAQLEGYLSEKIRKLPEEQTRIFKQVVEMLHWFAGVQIRSVATLSGNIITGSPISDLVPILMASNAKLELQSKETKRLVHLDEHFYTGYRKNLVQSGEIVTAIHLPYTNSHQYCFAYKQARRRDDDIAIVNLAVNVSFKPQTFVIEDIKLALGGMSYKTVTTPKAQNFLKGKSWQRSTIEEALNYLLEDLPLDPGAPGGMVSYRKSLSLSLFFKIFLAVRKELSKKFGNIQLDEKELSGIDGFKHKDYKSSQYYSIELEKGDKVGAVHRPLVHVNAYEQATGEALYCDDLPIFEKELHLAFVLSTKAHARITLINTDQALQVSGVVDFFCAKDVIDNTTGPIVRDEEVFYNNIVTSQGQIIGAVLATDRLTAKKAANLVQVEYEDLQPVIITTQDAIKNNSFFDDKVNLVKGDVDAVFLKSPHILEGEAQIGGQEHFYLEPQTCIANPKRDEIEMYSATQDPAHTSRTIARVLGLPQNRVIVKNQKIGGGFGGKESKSCLISVPAAIAARKHRRPVRCTLDRDEDMLMTAGRHPFLIKYKVGFDEGGKILAADVQMYSNAGYSLDFAEPIMQRAVTHFENAYNIPAVKIQGLLCKTNLPSNTAFRGFGGPQGMLAGETMIENIANHLGIDPFLIRQANLQQSHHLTIYNQSLSNSTLQNCWEQVIKSSDYYERKNRVKEFNDKNRFKKRGLCVIPTKFGTSITEPFLNQGGALVLVYTDGSVLISHGGIEMGQGLYTKMLQVASTALGIPIEKIYTSETATDKVPNPSPTASSSSSDLNGMAIIAACEQINKRLKPYKEKYPNDTWEVWIDKAHFDRVNLAAVGYYKTPDICFDWEKNEGMLFNYFSWGAACCEVEIDTLTGDHQVHRVDIVMDVGNSLNPAIDVGQIEGAFMQGYGLFIMEECVYSPEGGYLTRGPSTYKIPGFGDIPAEFNVALLKNSLNKRAVYSSKGIGEPPLFLGSSVLFAIKDAIRSARLENGVAESFRLDPPATSAKIRMACQDNITSKIKEAAPGTFKPWNVIV